LITNGETPEEAPTAVFDIGRQVVAGRSALKTGDGSAAGAGVNVRLWVRTVDMLSSKLTLIVLEDGFEGEMLALSVDHGAMP